MKRYSDYMNEITQADLYKGLLGYGLFSEKLPPFLSSEDFCSYCIKTNPSFQDKPRAPVYYESMRNTNVPRLIGIPSPMAYQKLCGCISSNWSELQNLFSNNTINEKHTISRIHLRRMFDTPMMFKMNYSNWQIDGTPETELLIGSKYIVHADISTCFPSIYTHSIPWAIVGKDIAKARKGSKWRKEWYNQIDHYSQNCKYGETHGLLIGPHANNLLSEIILTDVDRKLSTKWNYIRNIDDYTCFVKTQEEAQLFLIKLSDELRKYDLTLNHKKTEIAELPMAMTEQWHRQIGNPATFFRNGLFDYISARTYFDSAIEIMHHNNDNSAILNYAIKTLPKDKMTKNAVEYCVKTIMHLCMIYPYLLQIIDKHVFIRYKVSADIIKTFAQSVYDQELKSHNYDGVCFALLFSIKYGFQLDTIKAQDAIDSDSCLFRLLSFLYFKKNAIAKERAQLRQLALNLKSNEEDFGRNWLFVYEVLPQSDLPEDWKTLKSNGISFIRKEYQ